MIYTTGLNQYTPDELTDRIAALSQEGTLLVVDARSSRYSSSHAFKNDFTARANANVGYRWDPRIGGHPDVPSLYDPAGRISYPDLIKQPFFAAGIDQLATDANRVANVLVVCACDNHATCHRSRAVGAALTERAIDTRELDGPRMTDVLEHLGPEDLARSAAAIPRANRHTIPQRLEQGREPRPVAVRAATTDRAPTGPSWRERLASRYAGAPERSPSPSIYVTTLDSAEAVETLEHQRPSFIVDFRQNVTDLAIADAALVRPRVNAELRSQLLRELHKLHDPKRPIAIVVDDSERVGMAVAIRDAGGLLAGLRADVRLIDSDGAAYTYKNALEHVSPRPTAPAPRVPETAIPERAATRTRDADIFEEAARLSAEGKRTAILIPTNLRLRRSTYERIGIMGAGLAKEARDRFPELALEHRLGDRNTEERPVLLTTPGEGGPYALIAFNTKHHHQNKASLPLIEAQAAALPGVVRDAGGFDAVLIPRLGAGHGGLRWDDVKSVLTRNLKGEPYVFLDDVAHDRAITRPVPAQLPDLERDDDYAATVRRAHERPPTDPRYAEFTLYARSAAAAVGDTRDPLGALLPGALRNFQMPALASTLPFPSVDFARRALLTPDSPDYQRQLAGAKGYTFLSAPPPKTERDASARDAARKAEAQILDYTIRIAIAQDPEIRDLLLSTKDTPIVYASNTDAWWGAVRLGEHYQGYNVLGKTLSAIRDELVRDPNALREVAPPDIPELQLLGGPLATYTQRATARNATEPVRRTNLRSAKLYAGIGQSDEGPLNVFNYHRAKARDLASAGYQLRTGGAAYMDYAHMLGVADFLANRYGENWTRSDAAMQHASRITDIWTPSKKHERLTADVGLPFHRFDETDPQFSWAIELTMKTHPNPRALRDFSLRAHGRNAVIALGEDGKHPVEFTSAYAAIGSDGLPSGGTRGVPAILAGLGDYPLFNTYDPSRITDFDAYVAGIEKGSLRFGDGRDANGQLYVAPRTGIHLAGENLMHVDPRITPLVGANLAQADLTGAVLIDLDMTRAYAPSLHAPHADLSGNGAGAYAPQADFSDATLRGRWTDATFSTATFDRATLEGDFRRVQFDHASLAGSDLRGDFAGANFRNANLTNARLSSEHPDGLRQVDLRGATIDGLTIDPQTLARIDELGIRLTDDQRVRLVRDTTELTRA